jgi:hypothetical protein
MAVASRSFQPSRIGLGSIRGAPRPAGRIENESRAAPPEAGRPTRPRTVPPITRAPSRRRRRRTFEGSSPNGREKYASKVS